MAIPVSRNAMPYVATMLSILMTLVFTTIAIIGLTQVSDPPGVLYLAPVAALALALNAFRMWRKFNLATSVMVWSFASMLFVIGLGAVVLRELVRM